MDKFVVSNSPFIHSGNDVNKMFLYTSLALIIPAIFGVMFFGINAFLILIDKAGRQWYNLSRTERGANTWISERKNCSCWTWTARFILATICLTVRWTFWTASERAAENICS